MGFSGGTAAVQSNNADFATQQLQQDISILTLQAGASATASDYDTMFIDIFSDSSGYDNTIDTGAGTTATFNTNLYENQVADGGTYANTQNISVAVTDNGGNNKCGWRISTANDGVKIVSITRINGCTADRGYILDASKSVLATATWSGDTATFPSPVALTKNTQYYAATGNNGGGNWTRKTCTDHGTYNGSQIYFNNGLDNGSDVTYGQDILTITGTMKGTGNAIVQTSAITIPTAPVYYQVYAKTTKAGTGTATFNISFDGGANYQNDKSLNTQYLCGANVGGTMILKLKLNGVGAGNEVTASNYGVILWT